MTIPRTLLVFLTIICSAVNAQSDSGLIVCFGKPTINNDSIIKTDYRTAPERIKKDGLLGLSDSVRLYYYQYPIIDFCDSIINLKDDRKPTYESMKQAIYGYSRPEVQDELVFLLVSKFNVHCRVIGEERDYWTNKMEIDYNLRGDKLIYAVIEGERMLVYKLPVKVLSH
jgi:hypothetical protein